MYLNQTSALLYTYLVDPGEGRVAARPLLVRGSGNRKQRLVNRYRQRPLLLCCGVMLILAPRWLVRWKGGGWKTSVGWGARRPLPVRRPLFNGTLNFSCPLCCQRYIWQEILSM